MHESMRVCMHVYTCVCMCMHVYACVYELMHVRVSALISKSGINGCTYAHIVWFCTNYDDANPTVSPNSTLRRVVNSATSRHVSFPTHP